MLKKIAVDQLRLGMHVHKLEGRWIEHPFWKTRFMLESVGDLQRIQGSGLARCWIDTRLGQDIAAPAPPPPAAMPAPPAPAPMAPSAAASRSFCEELRQAAHICQRGRAAVVTMFSEARMGRSINAESCLPLVEEITLSVLRNPGALVSLARLKTRDDYSYMHSVAVCALMVALARQIGLDAEATRQAGLAGLMHDIGKALMPLELLNKPGRLTEAEYRVICGHPERGHALLLESEGATPQMLDVVLHHHERVDGQGYPKRLPAEHISPLARMGAICDVYDAITSNRPYKTGWDPAESIARMASWQGQFDMTLFAAFVQSLGIYPTGSLVQLASGRLAVVVEQNAKNLVAPVVKVFYSAKSQMRIAPVQLDLAQPGCHDRITGRHAAQDGGFGKLDELWLDPELRQLLAV